MGWQLKTIGLNNAKLLFYSSIGKKSDTAINGLNQGVGRAVLYSGGSRGECVSLSFPASRNHPYSLAHGPALG